MRRGESFWSWQEQALGGLLAWGAGSVVAGLAGARAEDDALRHAARQAASWGIVDLGLAVNGRRSARRQRGTASAEETAEAVHRFRRILAINAALDVCYVLGGALLLRSAGPDRRRAGTGLGIIVQGLFLGVYDVLLLRGSTGWRLGTQ